MNEIELLIAFENKQEVLREIDNVKNLLQIDNELKLNGDILTYKNTDFELNIEKSPSISKEWNLFNISILSDTNKSTIYTELLSKIKKNIGVHANKNIIVLNNEISKNWSCELYPHIFKIENLMRKLIIKFMVSKIGIDWHKIAMPEKVSSSINLNKNKDGSNMVYELDFIHLSSILFKKYTIKNTHELTDLKKKLNDKKISENEFIKQIEDFIPKDNWTRYFSLVIDCESEELNKKWEDLYKIRCKVAHNNFITEDVYKKGLKLCEELEEILIKANNKVSEINISSTEITNIKEQTIEAVENSIMDATSRESLGGAVLGGAIGMLIGALIGHAIDNNKTIDAGHIRSSEDEELL